MQIQPPEQVEGPGTRKICRGAGKNQRFTRETNSIPMAGVVYVEFLCSVPLWPVKTERIHKVPDFPTALHSTSSLQRVPSSLQEEGAGFAPAWIYCYPQIHIRVSNDAFQNFHRGDISLILFQLEKTFIPFTMMKYLQHNSTGESLPYQSWVRAKYNLVLLFFLWIGLFQAPQ